MLPTSRKANTVPLSANDLTDEELEKLNIPELEEDTANSDSEDDFEEPDVESHIPKNLGKLSREEQEAKFGKKKDGQIGETTKGLTEIIRREVAVNETRKESSGSSSASASSSNNVNDPELVGVDFKNETQQYILVGIVNKKTQPPSDEAGICICGAFSTLDELRKQQEDLSKKSDINFTTIPFLPHTFVPICANPKRQVDEDYIVKKRAQILASYFEYVEMGKLEQARNVQEKKTGITDLDIAKLKPRKLRRKTTTRKQAIEAVIARTAADVPKTTNEKDTTESAAPQIKETKSSFRFPRECEIRGQNFAAVIFIHDKNYQSRKPNPKDYVEEPLALILQLFDTEEKTIKYIKKFAKKQEIKDFHIDCVNMYDILYPKDAERENDKVRKEWRDSQQNDIMNNIVVQKNLVESFKEYCETTGSVAPVTEISRDGEIRSTDQYGKVTEGGSEPSMYIDEKASASTEEANHPIPKFIRDADIVPKK